MDVKSAILILSIAQLGFAQNGFDLGEFLSNTFVNVGWNATWISNDQLIYKGEEGEIMKHTFNPTQSELSEEFISAEVLADYKGATVQMSSDNKLVLIKYNVISIFRHSTTAQYAVYNPEAATNKFADVRGKAQLQYCAWSPKGDSLVYVYENNIYYIPNAADPTTESDPITTDGQPGIIYNGVPDWVYEEEVLGTGSALWFSPDSQHLAYAKFIDNDVKTFAYVQYGEPGSLDSQYPDVIQIKYPKVGQTNPTFEVHCVKLSDTSASIKLNFLPAGPPEPKSEDFVLNDVIWASSKDVIVYYYTNRVQTGMELQRCDIEVGPDCVMEFEDENNRGWINIGSPIYKDNGLTALMIKSVKEGDDSYPQIVEIQFKPTGAETPRTSGKKTVTRIHSWDQENDIIYYESTIVGNHAQRHVYSAKLEGEDENISETCLTCDLITPEGKCQYATASFSAVRSYYALICLGPGPTYITIRRAANQNTQVWEGNVKLRDQLKTKTKPVIEDFSFTFKDDANQDYTVKARLMLPPLLKKDEDKKYPMVVDVYAGPDSNRISDVFSTGFRNYVTTRAGSAQEGYIYAYIDGRGSGLNGDNNMYSIYKKLGTVEIQDQIRATKELQKLRYVDGARTCIWGWSYGGFATAWVLAQDNGDQNYVKAFTCGLSVAPVTNFIYYDSIYTERYMGLPTEEDNKVGYDNQDLTAATDKFTGSKFFLIHGNADDNVHYQQSMLLARALELKDVPFETMSYPDENHSLRGVYPHLYHIIDKFFLNAFASTYTGGSSSLFSSSVLQSTLSILILSLYYILH